MRAATTILLILGMIVLLEAPPTLATSFVGVVKTLEGTATIRRGNQQITPVIGMEIQQSDVVSTGAEGRLGLVFSDDTRITMGSNTEIAVDDYLFEPKDKQLSLIIRLIKGTVSFLSGQIAKLAPESVQVVIPAGTIGVRGTHVLIKVD